MQKLEEMSKREASAGADYGNAKAHEQVLLYKGFTHGFRLDQLQNSWFQPQGQDFAIPIAEDRNAVQRKTTSLHFTNLCYALVWQPLNPIHNIASALLSIIPLLSQFRTNF